MISDLGEVKGLFQCYFLQTFDLSEVGKTLKCYISTNLWLLRGRMAKSISKRLDSYNFLLRQGRKQRRFYLSYSRAAIGQTRSIARVRRNQDLAGKEGRAERTIKSC